MLGNLKVGKKLAIGFGAVVLLIVASATFLRFQASELYEIEHINSVSNSAIDYIDRVKGDVVAAQSVSRRIILSGADSDRIAFDNAMAAYAADLAAARAIIAKDGPQYVATLDNYEKAAAAYITNYPAEQVRLASSPETRQQAAEMVTSDGSQSARMAMDNALARILKDVRDWSSQSTEAGTSAMDRMILIVTLSGVISALLAGIMAWFIGRAISRPIEAMTIAMQALAAGDHSVTVPALGQRDEVGAMAEAVQVFKAAAVEKERLEADALAAGRLTEAERARNAAMLAETAARQTHVVGLVASGLARLAGGDLAHRLAEPFPADYERLRSDFNAALEKLQDTMRTVTTSASAILSGTTEISTASDDLSRRTEQQAASLEETAAALDEITATVRKTAEGSSHARSVVGHARGSAEQSGLVVQQAVEAMNGIERSSREIGQIIGVIDEIAFQTNLLALNAGVEAARAGEAGRGFAVVASEVRALAQRSAEAAKEIKALISTSGVQVEQGVALVGQTGEALSRIVTQVAEIDGIVTEIAASAQEQATALNEVNTAVNQMDQVTQQNAAMVEEATAASQALAHETMELSRLIGQFQVADAGLHQDHRSASQATRTSRTSPGPVRELRVVGRGGAAVKADAASQEWAEF